VDKKTRFEISVLFVFM